MKKRILGLLFAFIFCVTAFGNTAVFAKAKAKVTKMYYEYKDGGQDVGYHDSDTDKAVVEGGTKAAGSIGVCLRDTEWVAYDFEGMKEGRYVVYLKYSSRTVPAVAVAVNGETVIKPVTLENLGDYYAPKEVALGTVDFKNGTNEIRLISGSANAFYYLSLTVEREEDVLEREKYQAQRRPYFMAYAPCMIQAENYDVGVNGTDYFDIDNSNTGKEYRKNEPVDIYKTADGRGFQVKMMGEEYLKYTFCVTKKGNYDLFIRALDVSGSSKIRIFVDNFEVVKTLDGIYGFMGEAKAGTYQLDEGTHLLTVKCMEGEIEFDYLRLAYSKLDGMRLSEANALRGWLDAQILEDEEEVEKVNPVMKEIYVSANGNDSKTGEKNAPFKTLKKAQEYIRTINKNMTGDIIVNLDGEFRIDETLKFTPEDSGSNGFNVIWDGNNKKSVIHGGEKVEGWTKVEGTPLYKAKVDAPDGFKQFYVDDNRALRARSQYLYYHLETYDDPSYSGSFMPSLDGFVVDPAQFGGKFSKPSELYFVYTYTWRIMTMPVESIKEREDGMWIVRFRQPYLDMTKQDEAFVPSPILQTPFYVENAFEFLDEEGEWYFDKETSELYYYPRSFEDMQTADCYIPKTEGLISIDGNGENDRVKNIVISGIDFKYGAWERFEGKGFSTVQGEQYIDPDREDNDMGTLGTYPLGLIPAQVSITYGEKIQIKNNYIRHHGSVGVAVNKQSIDCDVTGNIFDDLSSAAVTIGDWTIQSLGVNTPVTNYCRRIKVNNNLIRRVSVEYFTNGITLYYANQSQISHNDFLDTPYTAISCGWGWGLHMQNNTNNKISYNRIENVLYRTGDGAHIYTLDSQKGTIIERNHLIKSPAYTGGFYLDNGSSNLTYRYNVVEDTPKWLSGNWWNVKDNAAYSNYSETPIRCNKMDQNSFSEATIVKDGNWPEEAREIMADAGLAESYKHLYAEYENSGEHVNDQLKFLKWYTKPGVHIEPATLVEGGEGVAYHDTLSNGEGYNVKGVPSVTSVGMGINLHYIMTTIEGEWTKHPFSIDEAGEYDVVLQLSTPDDNTKVNVWIDDVLVADNVSVANSGSYTVFVDNTVGSLYLGKGDHVIKVEHAKNNFGFYLMRMVPKGVTELERNDGFNKAITDAIGGK